MVAALAIATKSDPLGLISLLHGQPEVFDSLWYSVYMPVRPTDTQENKPKSDIDEILGR